MLNKFLAIFGACKKVYNVVKSYLPSKSSKSGVDNSIGEDNSKTRIVNKPKNTVRNHNVDKSKRTNKSHNNDYSHDNDSHDNNSHNNDNSHGNNNSHDNDNSHGNDNSHDKDSSIHVDNSHGNDNSRHEDNSTHIDNSHDNSSYNNSPHNNKVNKVVMNNASGANVKVIVVGKDGSVKEVPAASYVNSHATRSFSTNSLRRKDNRPDYGSANHMLDTNKQDPHTVNSAAVNPAEYQKYRSMSLSNDKTEADVKSEQVDTNNKSLSGKASYASKIAKVKETEKAANNSQAANNSKGKQSHTHMHTHHSKSSKDMLKVPHREAFNGPIHFSASGHYPNEIKRPAGYGKPNYKLYSPTFRPDYEYSKGHKLREPYPGKIKKETHKSKKQSEYKDPDVITALFKKAFNKQKLDGNQELHSTYKQPEEMPLPKYAMGRTANGHSIITAIDRGNGTSSLASKQKGPNSSGPEL